MIGDGTEALIDELNRDMDAPDWHFKYARNIVYVLYFFALAPTITCAINPYRYYSCEVALSPGIFFGVLATFIVMLIIDNTLDQESRFVLWFNRIRFMLVLLTFLLGFLVIGFMALRYSRAIA